jgi:hypothetical protein
MSERTFTISYVIEGALAEGGSQEFSSMRAAVEWALDNVPSEPSLCHECCRKVEIAGVTKVVICDGDNDKEKTVKV